MSRGSRSSTASTESNTQNIQTSDLNLSDFEGVGVADADDVEIKIEQSDSGAVAAAEDIATGSLAVVGDTTAQALRTVEGGLDDALDFGDTALRTSVQSVQDIASGALDFGSRALDDLRGFGTQAISETSEAGSRAASEIRATTREGFEFGREGFNFGGNVVQRSLSFVQDILAGAQETFQRSTSTLSGAIDRASDATRTDSAIVLNNVAKFGAIAVGAVAVALIIRGR